MIEEERRILESIEAYGWYGVHIFDPELETPNFTYTVGFSQTLNAPEFIVFGLHRDVMFDMLDSVFRQIKAGRKLKENQAWKGLYEDISCVARNVAHVEAFSQYAVMADWFWKRGGNKGHPGLVQLVWPDWLTGAYPWEDGCRDSVREAQPQLWS